MNSDGNAFNIKRVGQKNKYQFVLDKNRTIIIDSDFDNGNISLIKQVSEIHYRLQAVPDGPSTKKTWFHFRAKGSTGFRLRFSIENVYIYENLYEQTNWPKPLFKHLGVWMELKDAYLTVPVARSQYGEQVGVVFDFTFPTNQFIYFCMTVPCTYLDSQNLIADIEKQIPDDISYNHKVGKSVHNLNFHVIKLTAKESKVLVQHKKPVVLITCRVHPGEVGSTHCLMGILNFLLRTDNLQTRILMRMFQFLIFPVVNPDGVLEGHYRMDANDCNLNRVYDSPSPTLHPTVHQIQEQIQSLAKTRRILFHFDLHSHSDLKPAFVYGNAYEDIIHQTESELYCKILEENSPLFSYTLSQFGERHMKMKDKGEKLSKQGCARVVLSKLANIIFSYTVQTSIFPYCCTQAQAPSQNLDFRVNSRGYQEINYKQLESKCCHRNPVVISNMLLGKALMVTILDFLQTNPYWRSSDQTNEAYRKEVSQKLLQSQERFKQLDIKAHQKSRMINKFAHEEFLSKYSTYWDYLASDPEFLNVKWPQGFTWFQLRRLPPKQKPRKMTSVESDKEINNFLFPKNQKRKLLNFQEDKQSSGSFIQPIPEQKVPQEKKQNNKEQLPVAKASSSRGGSKTMNRAQTHPFVDLHPASNLREMLEIRSLKEKEIVSFRHNIVLAHSQQDHIRNKEEGHENSNKLKGSLPPFQYRMQDKLSRSSKYLGARGSSKKIQLQGQLCEEVLSRRKQNSQDESELLGTQIVFDGPEMTRHHQRELAKLKLLQAKKRMGVRSEMIRFPQLRARVFSLKSKSEKMATLPDFPGQY